MISPSMSNEGKDFRKIYVIGDIHGRSDLLDRIVREIEWDLGSAMPSDCLTVTLGDYIDRGPDSRGVLDRLSRNPFSMPYVALRGNHEEMFELFLTNATVGKHWQLQGGLETLRSYGVALGLGQPGAIRDFGEVSRALNAAVPAEHIDFLSSLQLSLDLDQYFFCHAGVRPGVPFNEQAREDLLWIRDEFLLSNLNLGKIVVHGHTPVPQPEVRANRINIDTAAYETGHLTCLVLEDGKHRYLTS
jgi:serine/threonine protein phosphatase 1